MAVLSLKPHAIQFQNGTEGYEDDNGDYHDGTSVWVTIQDCDIVPNGEAYTITLADGTQKEYNYTIYLKNDCKGFELGEKVRLLFFGEGQKEGMKEYQVLGFHRYQLQSKMWI